ncbi:MAG: hypothetical protein ACHQVS_01755 [Candidatus Babeliales bacterium]
MEKLTVLEQKITALAQLVKTSREENARLVEHNARLTERNAELEKQRAALEKSMLGDTNRIKKFDEEQELTKTVIDDLIHSIDSLIENEHQQ